MQETIFISLAVKDLQNLISECVHDCLKKYHPEETLTDDQLLSIRQAAELLNLSVPTIYGLVSQGEIPYSKPGKRLYFSKQELLTWIKAGRKKTKAEIAEEADAFISKRRR